MRLSILVKYGSVILCCTCITAQEHYVEIEHGHRLPDTILGLPTNAPGYLVDFDRIYGPDFDDCTSTSGLLERSGPDEANILNPWLQPNTNLHAAYGSGDVNQDSIVGPDDYYAMLNDNIQNDFSDIDGNGIPSEQADIDLLYNYLTTYGTHLPGHGNQIIGQGVVDWNTNIAAIDSADTVAYDSQNYDCVQYSTQDMLNHGNYSGDDIPDVYSQDHLNRFNNKMYMLKYYDKATNIGHMMNCYFVKIGNSDDEGKWMAKEPQTDQMVALDNLMNTLPDNYRLVIQGIHDFSNTSNPAYPVNINVLAWDKDNGSWSNIYTNPGLVTSQPSHVPIIEPTLLDIDNENVSVSHNYMLGQNYPNPFNSSTTIPYNVPYDGHVKIDIINMQGRNIETLVEGVQEPGEHMVKFNASDYSSGTYIYEIKVGDKTDYKLMTGKMVLLK